MQRLFKNYSPNANSYQSLAMRGLWCNYAESMNDPFDCLGLVRRNFSKTQLKEFKKIISTKGSEKQKKQISLDDFQLTNIINETRIKSIQKYAFCSLSEKQNIILMWSHYAQAHAGFVIEFEFPELNGDHHLQKVRYEPILPVLDLAKFGKFMTGDEGLISYLLEDISIKSTDWSYEREWRIWRSEPSYYYISISQNKSRVSISK